ncbi:MAG: hypothetical protein JW900_02910 [Anaerolineae bacterium]|nr:hypothetical protein [Anaerolineae bacterium]
MKHKYLLLCVLVSALFAACSGEPAPVRTVRAFHQEISAIQPPEQEEGGIITAPDGFRTLTQIFTDYTTETEVPANSFTLAIVAGMLQFRDMEYELVSQDGDCAVVGVHGIVVTNQEESPFEGNYVLVRQGRRWLIDLDARSCE